MAHSHTHSSEPASPQLVRQQRRALGWMVLFLVPVAIWTVVAMVFLWPHNMASHVVGDPAHWNTAGVTRPKATITQVNAAPCAADAGTGSGTTGESGAGATSAKAPQCAVVKVHLDEGPEVGQVKELNLNQAVYASGVKVGQKLITYRVPAGDAGPTYQFADFQRTTPLLVLGLLFVVAVVAVARLKGLLSLVGLGFAFLVLGKFMFPALIVGHNPVLVVLVGSSAIMFVALYCAHGFSTRTTTALVGTLVGLGITAALGTWAAHWAHLTGVSNEDDFLLAAAAPDLKLRSMVLCGIIVAGLGVLNDVTITQSSAVWELAATERRRGKLFASAMRIGRDHIASTVYTTAFASAGAAMGVLLLLTLSQRPLGQAITSEQFAGEVVRTLVGSIGLVLAVPVTTAVAVAAVSVGARQRTATDRIAPEQEVEQGRVPIRQHASAEPGPEPEVAPRHTTGRPAVDDPSIYQRPGRAAD